MKTICILITALVVTLGVKAQEKGSPPKIAYLKDKDTTAVKLEIQPQFPGGLSVFYGLISSSYKVPKVKDSMTALILVSFVVEKDGSMSNYEIVKDPGYGMGDELIRVLKLIKERWSPGMIDGKPVRASYNLPVTLNIK